MAHHESLLDREFATPIRVTSPAGVFATLDPRVRLVAALAGAIAAVALQSLVALTAAFAVSALALVAARPDWRAVGGRLLALEGFMVMIVIMLPFTVPPTEPHGVLFTWGPLAASEDGLHRALGILMKTNIVVLLLTAMIGGLDATVFGRALAAVGLPGRLVTLLLMTVRYLDVLRRDYGRLRRAMRVRGFRARADRHSLRSIGYLVGMLLVRSFDRSERILNAMRCRGFDGTFRYDALMRPGRGDAVLGALTGLAIAACLGVDWAVA